MAVVDPAGRVIGVDALVMPAVPYVNPNLSAITIAEKVSGAILSERSVQRVHVA